MMLKLKKVAFLRFTCLLLLVCACTGEKASNKESSFFDLVPVQGMNQQIRLKVDPLTGSMQQGYAFSLRIENISSDSIWFPDDFSTRILMYNKDEGKWVDIKNNVTTVNPGEGYLLDSRGKDTFNIKAITSEVIAPDLPKGYDGKIIRVIVIGKIYSNGSPTDELVGAWIDAKLPKYKEY